MMVSLLTSIFVVGACYVLLSRDISLLNILSVSVVYGFVSFVIYILLNLRYSGSGWLNEVAVSVIYMVIMYNSTLTGLLTKSRR